MARILIIDDSESALELVGKWVTEAGHSPVPAILGRLALARLKSEKIDLVITDIFMPEPDGLEILREARRANFKMPFIAMSSKGSEFGVFKVAKAYGAVSALQKPFSKEELLKAVDAALAGAQDSAKTPLSVTPTP